MAAPLTRADLLRILAGTPCARSAVWDCGCHEECEAAICGAAREHARLQGEIERMRPIYEAARWWSETAEAARRIIDGRAELVERVGDATADRLASEAEALHLAACRKLDTAIRAAGPRP